MNSEHNQEDQATDHTDAAVEYPIPQGDTPVHADPAPPWASALRDLYQQVVDEPLPDALADLIARLDREGE